MKKIKQLLALVLTLTLIFSLAAMPAEAAKISKAIVYIPGIVGSRLLNSNGTTVWGTVSALPKVNQLKCSETGSSVNAITADSSDENGAFNSSKFIFNALKTTYKNSYDVLFFSYDWRLSCGTAAKKLQSALSNYSSVIIVAHSMGGLVASKFIAMSAENRNKVKKFISIGTPYLGAVKGLWVMETGRLIDVPVDIDIFKALACNFPSIYELLPNSRYPYAYIKNGSTTLSGFKNHWTFMKQRPWAKSSHGSTKTMFGTAHNFHNSLMVNSAHIANTALVDTYKIYGVGQDTISRIDYDANGKVKKVEAMTGDGTVVVKSAINGQRETAQKTYLFPYSHLQLVKEKSVVDKIKSIINGTVKASAQSTKKDAIAFNEKGWLIGENNKRVNIIINNTDTVSVFTKDGQKIYERNNLLYCSTQSGEHHVGYIWKIAGEFCQYSLFDGEYAVIPNKDTTATANYRIEYIDNGYCKKSTLYQNIIDSTISIASFKSKVLKCIDDRGKIISPTKTLSAAELNAMNNDLPTE